VVGETIEEAASPVVGSVKYQPVYLTGVVPANAAKVRLGLEMVRNAGSNLDAYYCRMALLVSAADSP